MNLVLLAVVTSVFFGAYNFFIKISSGHINQIVGAVILQVVAAVLGGIVFMVLKATNAPIEVSQKGVTFAILAGIMVGLAEIASFFVFSKGLSASVGTPIIIGGAVVVGSLLGLIFLKENLTSVHYLAIALIVVGVILLSTK
jgi:transporter family protein